jgi:hypothetical protein
MTLRTGPEEAGHVLPAADVTLVHMRTDVLIHPGAARRAHQILKRHEKARREYISRRVQQPRRTASTSSDRRKLLS